MWRSDLTLSVITDRVRTNQTMRVYPWINLLLNNTNIGPSGVKYQDLDETQVMYKNRTMNAEKMVYLLMILPRYRLYLTVSVPIPNQPYSGWTVLSVFTPRSTRSLFFVLFRVRQFILSSPIQNSPTKLLKPCLGSSQVRLKSIEPSILFWITVYPPPAIAWPQYSWKAPEPSESIV